jgi:hypothetical protein
MSHYECSQNDVERKVVEFHPFGPPQLLIPFLSRNFWHFCTCYLRQHRRCAPSRKSMMDLPIQITPNNGLSQYEVQVGGADDLSYFIKRVTFRLHETYPNHSRSYEWNVGEWKLTPPSPGPFPINFLILVTRCRVSSTWDHWVRVSIKSAHKSTDPNYQYQMGRIRGTRNMA